MPEHNKGSGGNLQEFKMFIAVKPSNATHPFRHTHLVVQGQHHALEQRFKVTITPIMLERLGMYQVAHLSPFDECHLTACAMPVPDDAVIAALQADIEDQLATRQGHAWAVIAGVLERFQLEVIAETCSEFTSGSQA